MSEETSWTDHVMSGKAWFRFLLMVLFTPFLGCAGFLILAIALFQFFAVLASGESNPQLRELARDLSRFAIGIVDFLTYNTEEKPFPFTSPHPAETVGGASPPVPGTQRPVRRKAAKRKKPVARRRSTATRKEPVEPATEPGEEIGTESPSGQTETGDTSSEKHGE